jgi:hypothetical protein
VSSYTEYSLQFVPTVGHWSLRTWPPKTETGLRPIRFAWRSPPHCGRLRGWPASCMEGNVLAEGLPSGRHAASKRRERGLCVGCGAASAEPSAAPHTGSIVRACPGLHYVYMCLYVTMYMLHCVPQFPCRMGRVYVYMLFFWSRCGCTPCLLIARRVPCLQPSRRAACCGLACSGRGATDTQPTRQCWRWQVVGPRAWPGGPSSGYQKGPQNQPQKGCRGTVRDARFEARIRNPFGTQNGGPLSRGKTCPVGRRAREPRVLLSRA